MFILGERCSATAVYKGFSLKKTALKRNGNAAIGGIPVLIAKWTGLIFLHNPLDEVFIFVDYPQRIDTGG